MIVISLLGLLLLVFPFSATEFSWSDCAPDRRTSWLEFYHISVSPSPVRIPGYVTISIDGEVKHNIPENVTLNIIMEKELLGRWTKIPCIFDIGTCTYDSPCEFLKHIGKNGCPPALQSFGISCTCPFKLSSLSLLSSVFEIKHTTPTWRFLLNGDYRMRVEFKHGCAVIGCFSVKVQFRVDSAGIVG